MAEEKRESFSVNWAALVALLVASSSAVLFFRPLSSSRPPAGSDRSLENLGYDDVDARLWQDPFRVAIPHRDKALFLKTNREIQSHAISTLRAEIAKASKGPNGLVILPVMILGG